MRVGPTYWGTTRKMLNLQHQHNNHTTTPHMRVDPTHWGPLSCEGLLCGCCDGVVYESNPGTTPVCGTHPHVKGCCAVVVLML
jgi:hypothetical protein